MHPECDTAEYASLVAQLNEFLPTVVTVSGFHAWLAERKAAKRSEAPAVLARHQTMWQYFFDERALDSADSSEFGTLLSSSRKALGNPNLIGVNNDITRALTELKPRLGKGPDNIDNLRDLVEYLNHLGEARQSEAAFTG